MAKVFEVSLKRVLHKIQLIVCTEEDAGSNGEKCIFLMIMEQQKGRRGIMIKYYSQPVDV